MENTANKLSMKSRNIMKNNIEKIGELFPNCIIDENGKKKINIDKLKLELSEEIDNCKERYQLSWPGKNESIIEANKMTTNTLRPIVEKSVNFENTENIYIEGENLEVLKIIQESYLEKIKCIYIDPPYNIGKDFIYNDTFDKDVLTEGIDSGEIDLDGNILVAHEYAQNTYTNGRFHSDWLSMMYPRLKIARNLLRKDGIIFISIDENEYANLKKICDEIFGENNFVASFNWMKTATPPSLSKSVRRKFEFVLCYSKSSSYGVLNGGSATGGDMPLLNESNKYTTLVFHKDSLKLKIHDGIYKKGQYDRTRIEEDFEVKDGKAVNNLVLSGNFKWTQETVDQETKDGTEFWVKTTKFAVRYSRAGERIKIPSNIISKEECGVLTNEEAQKEIVDLFGQKVMDYPKPTSLIKYLINMCTTENDIVMDFFSGSATTAEACMAINRKFILVQLPEVLGENRIAYKMGYRTMCDLAEDRIIRASKKITKISEDNIDYGFRVFKLDTSNMEDVYYEPTELTQTVLREFEKNVKEDRTPEDLLVQVILNLGLTLDVKIDKKEILGKKVFFINENLLVACFDEGINLELIEKMCEAKPSKIVFRENALNTDSLKINIDEKIQELTPETEKITI